MLIQLNPPIPIKTPKGLGLAHFIIDYGIEFNLIWVVFQNDSGECWSWDNSKIRADKNITLGRTFEKANIKTKKKKKVMHEWKKRDLHSGSKKGPLVHNQKQAIAIALSEAKKGKK